MELVWQCLWVPLCSPVEGLGSGMFSLSSAASSPSQAGAHMLALSPYF